MFRYNFDKWKVTHQLYYYNTYNIVLQTGRRDMLNNLPTLSLR